MKLTVNKSNLLKGLKKVINVIGTKSTLPVLGNVMLEAKDGQLVLTSTDLEIRITAKVEAEIQRDGKTTLPARKLDSLVSKFIDDKVLLDCDEKHHTRISCGTSDFKLLGLPADDFPLASDFSVLRKIEMKEHDFSRIMEQISYAVSLDDSRKVLHGVLFSIRDNTITAVATDGKRLALVEKLADEFSGEDGDVIIPLKSANEAKRIFDSEGKVTICFGEKQISFSSDTVVIDSKLIEGNYPNYRQVIPGAFKHEVEVPTSLFSAKLDLVSIALPDNSHYLVINFGDKRISFSAGSSKIGEGNDYIEADYSGDKVEISFNPAFLSDPFRHCDADKVKIKFNDNVTPVAISGGEGFLYVIMPMRNR